MKILAFLITFSLGITQSSVSAASAEHKAPCRVEVDNAHLSANLIKKESKFAVKVVFRSICNLDQENLIMKVQVMKTGFLGDHAVTSVITRKYSYVLANHPILIQDIYVYCKTGQETRYFGEAEARANINSTPVRAPKVRSKKIIPLPCGT